MKVQLAIFLALFAITQAKTYSLEDDLLSSLISVQNQANKDSKVQQDYYGNDEGDEEDDDDDDIAAQQLAGLLARHGGRLICKRLEKPYILEQNIEAWLNKDAKIMQEQEGSDYDDYAELERWRLGKRIKKFYNKHKKLIHRVGRGVCKAVKPNVAEQNDDYDNYDSAILKQDYDDNDDDDDDGDYDDKVAAQFFKVLQHASGLACKHLNRPEVLEQNIEAWLNKDAKIMQDEDDDDNDYAELERRRFGSRIKKFYNKHKKLIHGIGRGVCSAINPIVAEQDYGDDDDENDGYDDDDDDIDNEAAAQFFGFLARHAGRYACKRLNSRPEVLEQNVDDWLNKDVRVMEEEDDDSDDPVAELERWRIFRKVKKFFKKHAKKLRRIGRGVCKAVFPKMVVEQDYGDYGDYPVSLQQDDPEYVEAQMWGLIGKYAGRHACRYLRSRPSVLVQNVDNWADKEAKAMQNDIYYDDGKANMQWGWLGKVKKFVRRNGKTIAKVGRGVCKVIYNK